MLLALLAGCDIDVAFRCEAASQCVREQEQGQCISRACAFADAACTSALRFDDTASEELAGVCYDPAVHGPATP